MNTPRPSRLRLWCKRIVFAIAALITLLALALAVEHYRAKRLWLACQAELIAQGEPLLITDFRPPPLADDQNFARTPLLRPLTEHTTDPRTGEPRFRDPEAVQRLRNLFAWTALQHDSAPGWRLGEADDLATWQSTLREATNSADAAVVALLARPRGAPADDLLFLLDQQKSVLDELRAALQLPAANFHPSDDYSLSPLMDRASVIKMFSRVLRLAALCELTAGQTEDAANDVIALLRLAELGAGDPLLIDQLLQFALIENSIQPLWEGLAQHRWPETHLQQFDQALSRIQPIATMLRGLRGERAYSLNMLNNLPAGIAAPHATGDWRRPLLGAIIYQNQRRIARNFQEILLPAFDPGRGTVDVRALQSVHRTPPKPWSVYRIMADLLLPALTPCGDKAARTQATVNLARIGIALDRFRLAQGHYPTDLAELTPAFLGTVPPDPVTGKPPIYALHEGNVLLYYLGLNGQDEGGTVTVGKNGTFRDHPESGDWVWQYHPVTQTRIVGIER